jgi:hypothetical protein
MHCVSWNSLAKWKVDYRWFTKRCLHQDVERAAHTLLLVSLSGISVYLFCVRKGDSVPFSNSLSNSLFSDPTSPKCFPWPDRKFNQLFLHLISLTLEVKSGNDFPHKKFANRDTFAQDSHYRLHHGALSHFPFSRERHDHHLRSTSMHFSNTTAKITFIGNNSVASACTFSDNVRTISTRESRRL